MLKKYKKRIFVLLLFVLLFSTTAFAQESPEDYVAPVEEIFEARVIKILEEREIMGETGGKIIQQDILLNGLEGKWKNQEVTYKGISEIIVVNANIYKKNDRVLIQRSATLEGDNEQFYIIDFVRRGKLYLLAFLFAAVIIIIGRMKGFKSLVSLIISFFIIIKIILPRILAGDDPLLISIFGSLAILAVIIYLTEGWNRKSHLAIISVFISLSVTLLLSVIFTGMARLTGLAQEETAFLMGISQQAINFKGLLLAGMLIGAIGVLDDIIVGQMETVKKIKEANPQLPSGQVFTLAYKVGNTHLGTMVNTLFLTYAGASLPLLLLFAIKQEPFLTFSQVVNNEMVATEIVRTLVGSIGVALSMPISTYLAARWIRIKNKVLSEQG
jgi:uncharacterized membrane protein